VRGIKNFIYFFFFKEHIVKEGKRVRFKIDAEECKPMTGILLIKYMANNLATQEYLFNSDINKRNFYDLILYLQRVKVNYLIFRYTLK